eukprot:TRINITY_DN29353_c0_g1_i2.p1 TRINITY_DN29353_c0_g1~~TRINITY_DN29353_c0_g1_i2.p1  ORF type:complete len:338 (-),score=57.56 TRINITY_DN29353_c0_g1_i2:40-1053(-)
MESNSDLCICCDGWGFVACYGDCPLCDGNGDLSWSHADARRYSIEDDFAETSLRGESIGIAESKPERDKLFAAIQVGDRATIVRLLCGRADVNVLDSMGRRPLHEAARFGHASLVRSLLDRRAALEAVDPPGRTALHKAAASGHCGAVRVLLGARAAASVSDVYGQTPLHLAVSRGHAGAVRDLLAAGARVGATDNLRRTPLHAAERLWRTGVVDPLVDHGADLHARDAFHRAPLEGFPDRVVDLRFVAPDQLAGDVGLSVGINCFSLAGDELASIRMPIAGEDESRQSATRELLSQLAEKLAVPQLKLRVALPDGRLLEESDDLVTLAREHAFSGN